MGAHKIKLTDKQILKLLKAGVYRVDIDTGEVYGRRSNKPLTQFEKEGRWFVRLYHDGDFRRCITVARLVWMAATMRTIPRGFEVHHDDKNRARNVYQNLYCLYEMDHAKLHGKSLSESQEEEIPF